MNLVRLETYALLKHYPVDFEFAELRFGHLNLNAGELGCGSFHQGCLLVGGDSARIAGCTVGALCMTDDVLDVT